MSFDPQKPDFPNYEMPTEPKSSRKWWIIGGIGCFTVALLCCGGGGAFYLWVVQPAQQFVQEQVTFAESSPMVADLLGSNPNVDEKNVSFTSENKDGEQILQYSFPISGDTGSGTYIFKGKMLNLSTWELISTKLKIDDVEHDLDPDAEFQLDIDDGGGDF